MSSIIKKWSRDIREKNKISFAELDKIIEKDKVGGPNKAMAKLPEPEGWDQTDSILIECEGYWWLQSSYDPRWKAEGKAIVGGRDMCKEAKMAFKRLKDLYGPKVPWDLTYRFEPRNLKKFRLAGDNIPL